MSQGAISPALSLPLIPAAPFEIGVSRRVGSRNLAAESALGINGTKAVSLGMCPEDRPMILPVVNLMLFHVCVYVYVYIYISQYIHVIYIHTYIYVALFALPIYKTPDKVVGVDGELFSCS